MARGQDLGGRDVAVSLQLSSLLATEDSLRSLVGGRERLGVDKVLIGSRHTENVAVSGEQIVGHWVQGHRSTRGGVRTGGQHRERMSPSANGRGEQVVAA